MQLPVSAKEAGVAERGGVHVAGVQVPVDDKAWGARKGTVSQRACTQLLRHALGKRTCVTLHQIGNHNQPECML